MKGAAGVGRGFSPENHRPRSRSCSILPVRRQVQQDRGVGEARGLPTDVVALALAGVGAEQQDVERLVLDVVLDHLVGPVGAERVLDVHRGDVALEVAVDEEARRERDDQDRRHGDGDGLHGPMAGHAVTMARGV